MRQARTVFLMLLAALAGGLLLNAACKPMDVQAPPRETAQNKGLKELKENVIANSRGFLSMRADCQALLRTPLVKSPPELKMEGSLLIAKPRKIYLELRDAGTLFLALVGNGKEYRVKMPIYNQEYSGAYDEPLMPVSGRVHFMPDDLADALDAGPLFAGTIQVLRSYPQRWEILPGMADKPLIFPAAWVIDSTTLTKAPESAVKVVNSITIDRTTEQVLQLDKFRMDGSLEVRIWVLRTGVARGPNDVSARVPEEILIWYPSPVEGTIIRMRLSKHKLNVPVPAGVFDFD